MIYQPYPWGGGYSKSEVDILLNSKANSSHTHTKSQITDFPSYGTTANTICEGNDSRLSDARTPTSHTHTKSEITDFPSLATVATSGSYSDLSNKPTIPTVNNATLTIQKNGTTVKTFTANASSNVTANISVPTKTSDLTNDSGFLTSHQDLSGYVPKSGGAVMTGTNLGRYDDTSSFSVCGGTDNSKGGSITIYGKDKTNNNGEFSLVANDGTSSSELWGNPNGTLTWGNKDIDTIEEQGDGYIRYSNGLQICWGSLSVAIGTSLMYDQPSGMYYGRGHIFNYPKGFSSIPVVSLCVFTSNAHPFLQVCVESSADNIDKKLTTGSIMLFCKCAVTIRHETSIHIQAIGRWK